MSVHTDRAVQAFRALIPDPERTIQTAPITGLTYQPISGATSALTVWVDLGSGPVMAASGQAVLNLIQTLGAGTVIGRYAIVAVASGSPIVLDLLGSIVQTL